jgi:putative membrane protein
MSYFSKDFQTQITKAVQEIEIASHAELVVIAKPRTATYLDVPLKMGVALAFLALTFFMFTHWVFGDFTFYLGVVISFWLGFFLTNQIPALFRKVAGEKRMLREVEIYGRALFQKGHVYDTQRHIGLLIYVSVFEQQVFLLPDKGIFDQIPGQVWQELRADFQTIFQEKNIEEAFLRVLLSHKETFAKYVPQVENDINELDDHMEIAL